MSYISQESLIVARELLKYNMETCGYIKDGKLFQNIIENGREMCRQKIYSEYIWHTHPYYSKGYPSSEDIIKIMKKRKEDILRNSIIFTSWGIWEIIVINKQDLNQKEINKVLNNLLKPLYYNSEKGRIFKPLVFPFIKLVINNIKNYFWNFKINIYFTPWENIGNRYILS